MGRGGGSGGGGLVASDLLLWQPKLKLKSVFKIWDNLVLFGLFPLSSNYTSNLSVDAVLGIRTLGRRWEARGQIH